MCELLSPEDSKTKGIAGSIIDIVNLQYTQQSVSILFIQAELLKPLHKYLRGLYRNLEHSCGLG